MRSGEFLPGFLAVNADAMRVSFWGVDTLEDETARTAVLTRVARTAAGSVPPGVVEAALREDPASLTRLLPPFGAVRVDESAAVMVADSMGFRQLYHSAPNAPGTAAMSTSAIAAAEATNTALDETAVAVQSLLGWQLGQRTMYAGVRKLEPDATARLDAGGVRVSLPADQTREVIPFADAVRDAASLLRVSIEALLDDHPDAVLQLTGGQDSRILLSAIPPSRRRGLRAMTVGAQDSGDVQTAAQLAAACGLHHEVHGLGDAESLDPEMAWSLCRSASMRLDGMSDPIALAALGVAESQFDQGVRISGLGGEVARGFYYVGRVRERAYGRTDADRLARWRMFVNEAVEVEALRPDFSAWARAAAEQAVFDALSLGGPEWFRATDTLYLRDRMQRWAGVTDTAVAYERVVINPMLDESFIRLAAGLAPADKANSRFLASLQMALDPELGRIPLEGRPAPIVYAEPGAFSAVQRAATTGRKALKKVHQRIRRGTRAPAGGETIARKVVEHWRRRPEILDVPALERFVQRGWIDEFLAGRTVPRPSSVAFLTNLIVLSERSPRLDADE